MGGIRGMRLRRWLGITVVTLVAVGAVGSAAASQQIAITRSSTFDSTNEGWYVNDDDTFSPATWQSSGGNPNGYISGQLDPDNYGDFQSSVGAWAGDALDDYGGTLTVDISAPSDNAADVTVGFFTNNGSVLPCERMGAVGAGWETKAVTLDTSHLVDCATTKPLTGAQASAALAGFQAMVVFPYGTGTSDIFGIDNAALSGPQLAETPPTGAVTRAFTLAYKSRTFKGELLAKDDFSCAGRTKVTIFRKAKKPVKAGTATTSAPNLEKEFGPTTFSFKLKKVVRGSYYAAVTKSKSSLDGNRCNAEKSKSVRVR
jgi:hypothetical protein